MTTTKSATPPAPPPAPPPFPSNNTSRHVPHKRTKHKHQHQQVWSGEALHEAVMSNEGKDMWRTYLEYQVCGCGGWVFVYIYCLIRNARQALVQSRWGRLAGLLAFVLMCGCLYIFLTLESLPLPPFLGTTTPHHATPQHTTPQETCLPPCLPTARLLVPQSLCKTLNPDSRINQLPSSWGSI